MKALSSVPSLFAKVFSAVSSVFVKAFSAAAYPFKAFERGSYPSVKERFSLASSLFVKACSRERQIERLFESLFVRLIYWLPTTPFNKN